MSRFGPVASANEVPRYLRVLGISIGVVLLAELVVLAGGGSSLLRDGQYLAGVLTTVPCLIGIAYCGYQLDRTDLSPARYPRIAGWTVGGASISIVFNLVLVLVTPTDSVLLIVSWIRWAVAVGAAVGVLIGCIEGRAIERAITAERAVVRTEQLAEQRDLLDYLNSVLRHEVLNSASMIDGYASLLLEESDLDEEEKRWLGVIKEESHDMSDVVDDVRVLLATTKGSHELKRIDLARVVESEVRKLRNRYPDAAVETSVPESAVVSADELLPRVFGNLLSNAVEHNDAATPRVRLSVEPTPDTVRVEIEDNGSGIPDEERDSLFERDTEHGRTHGLGLYLADELLSRYGGRIELVRTGRDGSLFAVELPRASLDAGENERAPRSPDPGRE